MRGLLISSRGQTLLLARPATYLVEHQPYHAKQFLPPTRYHPPPSHATPSERDKVRHRGIGDELRAEQGPREPIKGCIREIREQ